jgi:hypothetical protein
MIAVVGASPLGVWPMLRPARIALNSTSHAGMHGRLLPYAAVPKICAAASCAFFFIADNIIGTVALLPHKDTLLFCNSNT